MKIRRILATAVAAAVTTPVVLLSTAPAFADTKPSGPASRQEQQGELEKLREAVAVAQAAYDAADAAYLATIEPLADLEYGTTPVRTAADKAKKAADKAAANKATADQGVIDAQKKFDEAVEGDKAGAQAELDEAKLKAKDAADAKTAADAEQAKADKALSDALTAARAAKADALKKVTSAKATLDAAQKALEEAEGAGCTPEPLFTARFTGPAKVTAGGTADYTLRLTNGTAKAMDEVSPFLMVRAFDLKNKPLDARLKLQYSLGGAWKTYNHLDGVPNIGALGAKAHKDIKLRLTVDSKAAAGNGAFAYGADYWNDDESCGGTPELEIFEFAIAAKKPGKPGSGSTGGTGSAGDSGSGSTDGNGNTSQQGGQSNTAASNGSSGSSSSGGNLATTGAGSATMPLALAGGSAVVLGAGAVFIMRRRKAGTDA